MNSRLHVFQALALLGALSATTPSGRATPQTEQTITPGFSANTWNIDWEGVSGRTYFVQYSLDLVTWQYAPFLDFGESIKAYGVEVSSPPLYLRLSYVDDSSVTDLQQAADGHFDTDGISNSWEVEALGTDPFANDSDGDGTPDDEEDFDGDGITAFLEVLMGISLPYVYDSDGDGLSDAEEIARGLNPLLEDTDGDGELDDEDALGLDDTVQSISSDPEDTDGPEITILSPQATILH